MNVPSGWQYAMAANSASSRSRLSPTVRIDLAGGEHTGLTRLAAKVCGLGISPDGTTVVAGGWGGTGSAVETRTGQERWRLASLARCLRFSPDGQLLALAGAGVMLVDPADGSVRRRLLRRSPPSTYQHLAWSPDARTVAIGNEGPVGERVSVWRWQGAGEGRPSTSGTCEPDELPHCNGSDPGPARKCSTTPSVTPHRPGPGGGHRRRRPAVVRRWLARELPRARTAHALGDLGGAGRTEVVTLVDHWLRGWPRPGLPPATYLNRHHGHPHWTPPRSAGRPCRTSR